MRLDDGVEVGYDYLILACRVTANFFGVPGAAEHARTTYTRAAAIGVRDRVLGNLEAYAQGSEGAVEPVAIVVGAARPGSRWLARWLSCATPVTRTPTPRWTRSGCVWCWWR